MAASLRRLTLPLAAYLGVAVVMPLLNGAATRDGFLEHCVAIFMVCGVLVVGIAGLHIAIDRIVTRRNS